MRKKEGELYEEASGSPMVRTVPREQKRYRLHLAHLPDTAVSIVLLAFDSGQRKSAHEYAPGGGVRAADRADLGTLFGVICALVEISIVRKHRRSPKTRQPVSGREKAAGKPFSLEQLAALAEENDIVELRLLHGSRTVTAGSSSDYTPQKGFFDKRYYVGSKEMETIDDFRRALEPYAPGGTVTVLTIDGVKPQ